MIDRICSLLKMKKPEMNRGLLFASGATVPTDGTDGYQTGCIFQHTDGSAATALYVNEGTATSCDFNPVISPGSISGHATVSAAGTLTLATVTKTCGIALTDLRCSAKGKDALPDAPDATDLGLADAIGSPVVGTTTNGGATAAATEKAAFDFVVPPDYVAGQDLTVRINAKVSAARQAASPLDVVAKLVKGGALDATDLCTTAAQEMKAVTDPADKDFTIDGDASGDALAPGSVLHVEISFKTDDTGATADGYAQINSVSVLVPSYR